ncbi:unnamed protein product [Dicrocoelium dendriticum]|nr:unnamed protein product [Dicrocoelium dendriticum]
MLSCEVTSNPTANIQWYFNKHSRIAAFSCDLLNNDEKKYCAHEYHPDERDVLAPVISKLTIFRISPDDFGDYVCSASSIMGERNGTTSLRRLKDPFQVLPNIHYAKQLMIPEIRAPRDQSTRSQPPFGQPTGRMQPVTGFGDRLVLRSQGYARRVSGWTLLLLCYDNLYIFYPMQIV